ncbi:MAG: hypothetical protein ACK4K2_00965 [Dehalococcoidia bacterium]
MALLVGFLLALVSGVVVLWPLWRRRWRPQPRGSPEDLLALEARWHALLDEMVALQTDTDLGRIPAPDAQRRFASLRYEAALVLKALQEQKGGVPARAGEQPQGGERQ